ncbi:hypothetical protein GCM10010215_50720 [Streptomyces virginiae]|uniref:Uncharacterized protein n=1 Tax=Streptomyces virginiae TaxID=1961 RepID=A0ABQ3NQ43_STRVG|nr:hypothetical protein GCM10010215_50720 [Streptomyces virginiae]GHI14902.1 hypothetical protein Scinn_43650 [Streptomyces virginiae]
MGPWIVACAVYGPGWARRGPEAGHPLGNLLDNAAKFSPVGLPACPSEST